MKRDKDSGVRNQLMVRPKTSLRQQSKLPLLTRCSIVVRKDLYFHSSIIRHLYGYHCFPLRTEEQDQPRSLLSHWVSKHFFPAMDEAQVCSVPSLLALDNLTLSPLKHNSTNFPSTAGAVIYSYAYTFFPGRSCFLPLCIC